MKGEDPTTRFGGLPAGCPLITLVFAPKTRTAACHVPKTRRATPENPALGGAGPEYHKPKRYCAFFAQKRHSHYDWCRKTAFLRAPEQNTRIPEYRISQNGIVGFFA